MDKFAVFLTLDPFRSIHLLSTHILEGEEMESDKSNLNKAERVFLSLIITLFTSVIILIMEVMRS